MVRFPSFIYLMFNIFWGGSNETFQVGIRAAKLSRIEIESTSHGGSRSIPCGPERNPNFEKKMGQSDLPLDDDDTLSCISLKTIGAKTECLGLFHPAWSDILRHFLFRTPGMTRSPRIPFYLSVRPSEVNNMLFDYAPRRISLLLLL